MSDHISRGFTGRRRLTGDPARMPPGQYLTRDFPVLSAGPTPRLPLDEWTFAIDGAVDSARTWTWKEFLALPHETLAVDIHCVTKWSKLDTSWRGVSVDTLLDGRDRWPLVRRSRHAHHLTTHPRAAPHPRVQKSAPPDPERIAQYRIQLPRVRESVLRVPDRARDPD